MATITVKNIPDELYKELKNTASIHRRSINNEIIYCIENTIKSKKINPDELFAQLDDFYKNLSLPLLTEEKLKEYKQAGRL